MLFELSNTGIILANCLGIPAAHLGISWLCERLPRHCFAKPIPTTPAKLNPIYESFFLIRRWKNLLPTAPSWISPFSKASLQSTDRGYLKNFITETRRGEFAHWMQWMTISIFVVWNPYPANIIILTYAALVNTPCILNLRYTRQRLINLLHH